MMGWLPKAAKNTSIFSKFSVIFLAEFRDNVVFLSRGFWIYYITSTKFGMACAQKLRKRLNFSAD